MTLPLVRALFRSVRIAGASAPNDTAHLKIYYPARHADSEMARNTGQLPVASSGSPFPVVILLPGINVGSQGFGWLAQRLSARGLVVVTYSLIGEEFAGHVSLTPGIDMSALTPQAYGTRPSALAIGPIVSDLAACNREGLLAGHLDLAKIALGGHSAGGTVALLNANPDWFAGVCAAFSYGAHTAAATLLGHELGVMNSVSAAVPVLIMGGSQDGVIAASAGRYGDPIGDATARVVATFDQAVTRCAGDSVVAIIKGANHFSIIHPQDDTTGRAFLDWPDTAKDAKGLIEDLIWAFLARAMGLSAAGHTIAKMKAREDVFCIFKEK